MKCISSNNKRTVTKGWGFLWLEQSIGHWYSCNYSGELNSFEKNYILFSMYICFVLVKFPKHVKLIRKHSQPKTVVTRSHEVCGSINPNGILDDNNVSSWNYNWLYIFSWNTFKWICGLFDGCFQTNAHRTADKKCKFLLPTNVVCCRKFIAAGPFG